MASLRQIKTKISSVTGTRRIMSAMKLISAVKLQKVQGVLIASRPYSDAMKRVGENIAALSDRESHPLLRNPEERRRLEIVLLTSDRGLCGSFNSSLIRKLETFVITGTSGYEKVSFRFVGRRGRDHFKGPGVEVLEDYTGLNERNYGDISRQVAAALTEDFESGAADEIVLVYNYYKSALTQVITFERLLPMGLGDGVLGEDGAEGGTDSGSEYQGDYIYEPHKGHVLATVLPKYIEARVNRAVLETITSEHAARMAAMDSATRNADSVVKRLTLEFNKSRQAIITTELMDIVNGTESLKKGDMD